MDAKKLDALLRRLDDSALSAQIELKKAMHASGNLADFFDLRDDQSLSPGMQTAIVSSYKDAAIDSDIAHDYMIQTSNHIKALRSALEELFQLYN